MHLSLHVLVYDMRGFYSLVAAFVHAVMSAMMHVQAIWCCLLLAWTVGDTVQVLCLESASCHDDVTIVGMQLKDSEISCYAGHGHERK